MTPDDRYRRGIPAVRRGGALMSVFALLLIGVGLAFGAFFARGLVDWLAARSWEPVPATLLHVDLRVSRSSEGDPTYRVQARFEYARHGRRYVAERVDLHPGSDNLGDYHQQLHARLEQAWRTGKAVTAWVDPDDPSRAVLNRDMRWGRLAFGMLFPVVFGGVGVAMLVRERRAGRERKRLEQRKLRHPGQPWRWFDRWSSPEIKSASTTRVWMAVAFAVLWNIVSLPVTLLVPGEVAAGNHAALIALVFPVIGIGLVIWAVLEMLRLRRYGNSTLRLDSVPVPLGGELVATLTIPARLEARALEVQLACVHRYATGSGRNRRTREHTLWEDRRHVAVRGGGGPGCTVARIEMPVPPDQPAADEEHADNRTIWQLRAESEEPGVDYRAVFELPVFDTGEAANADNRPAARDSSPAGSDDWRETGVQHDIVAAGQRFRFPRLRMVGAGLGTLAIASVFTGAGVFLGHGAGHWVFGGIFALVGLLILWAAVTMLFQRSEIVVGNDRLRYRHGVFGGWHEVRTDEIDSIETRRSGSIGRNLYFRILLKRHGRERASAIADWVPGGRAARALAAHIARLARVRESAP